MAPALRRDRVWFCDSSFTRMRLTSEGTEEASHSQRRGQLPTQYVISETKHKDPARDLPALCLHIVFTSQALVPRAMGWLEAAQEQ